MGAGIGARRAVVDRRHAAIVGSYNWSRQQTPCTLEYACTTIRNPETGKRSSVLLQWVIAELEGFDAEAEVNHIDHDGLNNRVINLRPSTHLQACQYRLKHRNKRTPYKGIVLSKRRTLYEARLWVEGKMHYLGASPDPVEAAKMYDAGARKHFGEVALCNFEVAS